MKNFLQGLVDSKMSSFFSKFDEFEKAYTVLGDIDAGGEDLMVMSGSR